MDKQRRLLLGIIIVVFIIVMIGIMIYNKDTFFTSKVTITYPDGCVEKYVNKELVTIKCVEGRQLENQNIPDFDQINVT